MAVMLSSAVVPSLCGVVVAAGDMMTRSWTLPSTVQVSTSQLHHLMVSPMHPSDGILIGSCSGYGGLFSSSFGPHSVSEWSFKFDALLTRSALPPPMSHSACHSAGTARLYNTTTHSCLAKLQGHKGEISKVETDCMGGSSSN